MDDRTARREKSRTYFHTDRQPSALFFLGGQAYAGAVLDYSPGGVAITLSRDRLPAEEQSIPRMYIGSADQQHLIQGLKITWVRQDYLTNTVMVGVQTETDDAMKRLAEVMHEWTKGEAKPRDARALLAIPQFNGREHYSEDAAQARLDWAREVSGAPLAYIGDSHLDPESLIGNIENFVGAAQIPIGIAGPVLIGGTYAKGFIPVPIATTEGALVSSISRGAKACAQAGGVSVHVTRHTMLRAPVFYCRDLQGALNLERWVESHFEEIRAKTANMSRIAVLQQIQPFVFGNALHLRFYYTTGDAAGQNMTSACTHAACEWITDRVSKDPSIGYDMYIIEGHMSGDKKVNYQNFISGRGVSVVAEIFLPDRVLERVLRTSARRLVRGYVAAEAGAMHIGMVGCNINFANVIAGIFTATGQDIASVHESSCGVFKLREEEGGLWATVHLPSLVIGTVGGGTSLPTQRDALEIMGCFGSGKLFRLAEIIAATCLALDLSTLSAIASNHFVRAHETLGRNRPDKGASLQQIERRHLKRAFRSSPHKLGKIERLARLEHAGIISYIMSRNERGLYGLYRYRIELDDEKRHAVLKLKSPDTAIIDFALGLMRFSGENELHDLFRTHQEIFGFEDCHLREPALYRHAPPEVTRYCPQVYATLTDSDRGIYAILMEDLSEHDLLDTVMQPELWTDTKIHAALDGLAQIHAAFFDRGNEIPAEIPMFYWESARLTEGQAFLENVLSGNQARFPEMIPARLAARLEGFLETLPDQVALIDGYHKTLTHNDCTTRNLCMRKDDTPVFYDWELACYQNPQHDLVELLIFCLGDDAPRSRYLELAEVYRNALEQATGQTLDRERFVAVLDANALELAMLRMNLYLLGHTLLDFDFIERIYANLDRLLAD